MTTAWARDAVQFLRRAAAPATTDLSDRDLLQRFASRRDEGVLAALVARHGGLVLGTARRVLGSAHDAEDVFQATFFILARKAASIRWQTSVAGWLHVVAGRLARQARARAARRQESELTAPPRSPRDPLDEVSGRELCGLVDEELRRLPERYRQPLLLCCLEGLARDEAARRLDWPFDTLKWRLERGRALLRERLARRGVTLPAALTGLLVGVAAPGTLRAATVRAVVALAAGEAAPAGVSTAALDLARRFLAPRLLGGAKVWATFLVVCGLTGGAGLLSGGAPVAREAPQPTVPEERAAAKREAAEPPLPEEALARVGSARLRHPEGLTSISLSADGKWVVAVGKGSARVWDAFTGRERYRLPAGGEMYSSVALSPDGKRLLIVDSKSVRLVEWMTGEVVRETPEGLHTRAVIAPDARTFAYRDRGTIRVFDFGAGKELRSFPVGDDASVGAFSADGKRVALIDRAPLRRGSDTLRVFDLTSGNLVVAVTDPTYTFNRVALAPDGKTAATLGQTRDAKLDEALSFFDLATGKVLRRVTDLVRTSSCLAYAPDGKQVAVGTMLRSVLQVFDPATGKELRRLRCNPTVEQVVYSADGKTLACCKSTGEIGLWDAATGAPRPASPDPAGCVNNVRFTDGGNSLLIHAQDVSVRDWRTGQTVRRYATPDTARWIFGVSLSPDERLFPLGELDGSIRLLDSATGKEVRRLVGHSDYPAEPLLFAPDGRRLFSRGYDSTVRVWDVATGKELHRFKAGARSSGDRLSVSGDGRRLAALSREEGSAVVLRVWDVDSGRELRRVERSTTGYGNIALSPDGASVAWASTVQPNLALYDVASGRERIFADAGVKSHGVAFSPDGRTVATGTDDGTPRLWETASGKERRRVRGHESAVYHVAFSADGRYLASVSQEAPVYVWDVYGVPRENARDLGDADAVAAFSAVRRLIASPGEAVAAVRPFLRPAKPADAEGVKRLLRALDSDDFAEREKATTELAKRVQEIEPQLRKELAETTSVEMRRRLEEILQRKVQASPERLREARALEVLEQVRTPEARKLLEELAAGAPEAGLTRDAKATLQRVGK